MRFIFAIFFMFMSFIWAVEIKTMTKSDMPIEDKLSTYEMHGPDKLFTITAECDAERLKQIEASLSNEQYVILEYDYTVFFTFKNNQIYKVEIPSDKFYGEGADGTPLSDNLKECILNHMQKELSFETQEKGIAMIRVKFPVGVIPKK